MSLKFYTETGQKSKTAAILRAVADWIENSSNKRVKVECNIEFELDSKGV
jgi:hypothetical protein